MSGTNSNRPVDKNKLYIGIFSLVIILAILLGFIIKSCSNDNVTNPGNSATKTTAKSISVVSESGNQTETVKAKFKIRDVKFSKKINAIKKYEAKQKDTLDNPNSAESADGYTYLSFQYNKENLPTFFGTKPTGTGVGSMLTYVFYQNKLIELRIQYGDVGSAAYKDIVANITNTYGNATYSRAYSNGAQEAWWKTDEVTLDVICQEEDVVVYYRTNNK